MTARYTIIDYRDCLLLAEALHFGKAEDGIEKDSRSALFWDTFYSRWCHGSKPFSFSSALDPHIAVAGLNLALAAAYCQKDRSHKGLLYRFERQLWNNPESATKNFDKKLAKFGCPSTELATALENDEAALPFK